MLLQYCYITVLCIQGLSFKLIVQGRVEIAVMCAVTAALLYNSDLVTGPTLMLLVQGRGEMTVMSAVSCVLLHYNAIYRGNGCNVLSTGSRGNGDYACRYCSTVTSQCYRLRG